MRTVTGELTHDNLIAGGVAPVVTEAIIIAADQTILRGMVLELNDDGHAVVPVASVEPPAPIDPTKVYCIAAEDILTVAAAAPSVGYLSGEFNVERVKFPEDTTADDYKVALRNIGIFLKPVVKE